MDTFSNYFFEGGFGLERETLRIDKNGRLAQTSHPFDDPHLQRDFCENQLEIITGVNDSVKNAIEELAEWDLTARKKLADSSEKLHVYSNPPYFSDASEIPVAYSGKKIRQSGGILKGMPKRTGEQNKAFEEALKKKMDCIKTDSANSAR